MTKGQKIKYQGKEGKVTGFFEDIAYIRLKFAREDEMVAVGDLEFIVDNTPKKLNGKDKGAILTRLVEEESIKRNFKREIIILSKLIAKYPHTEFWLDGFRPALKVESLAEWYHDKKMEELYKIWSINLTKKQEGVNIEKNRVVEQVNIEKKATNLLDIL